MRTGLALAAADALRFRLPAPLPHLVAALLIAVAGACASPGRTGPPVPGPGDGLFVAGYHPWWAGDAWIDSDLDRLDRLYLFEIELQADGTLGDAHGWPGGGARCWTAPGSVASPWRR